MTETAPPPTDQRPALPRWSAKDQDLWVDYFEAFAGHLLARREASTEGSRLDIELAIDEGAIKNAAFLADRAMQETQYRFWIQRKARAKAKKRSGSKVARGRK